MTMVEGISDPAEYIEDGHLRLRCTVENCYKNTLYTGGYEGEDGHARARESFKRHLEQHQPGRTPDLNYISVTYSGSCTSCGRSFECDAGDDELIWCDHCGASWRDDGTKGRTDRENPYG